MCIRRLPPVAVALCYLAVSGSQLGWAMPLDTSPISGPYIGIGAGGFFPNRTDDKNAVAFTGEVGYQLNDWFRAQLAGNIGPSINSARVESLFQLPVRSYFRPYLAVGISSLHVDGETMFAPISAGGGIHVGVTSHIDLAVDYRYIQAVAPHHPAIQLISAGISYRFSDGSDREEDDRQRLAAQASTIHYLGTENKHLAARNNKLAHNRAQEPFEQVTPTTTDDAESPAQVDAGQVIYADLSSTRQAGGHDDVATE